MKISRNILVLLLTMSFAGSAAGQQAQSEKKVSDKKAGSLYSLNLKMDSLTGEKVELSKYDGKVLVFVNVASKCGFTPQYEQLQELHEKYFSDGLAIIGVPCNQFRKQEPGTAADIAEFCQKNYGVEFDMLAKVDVKGKQQCELYKFLTGFEMLPAGTGPVQWNFEKFILDRSGEPIARFRSNVKPTSAELVKAIESALGLTQTGKPYAHESQKLGKTYYLFSKEVPLKNSDKTSKIYFFAKDPNNKKGKPVNRVPADRVVSETKTGMLVLKKKASGK